MNYRKHVEWAFLAMLSGSAGISVKYLSNLSQSISLMTQSISTLSSQIEVLTTKLTYSEQKIYDHEGRIRSLEIQPRASRPGR